MTRLSDLESELVSHLTQLLTGGGSGNFLVVDVGPVYVQFAGSASEQQIHFEAVGNEYLPTELQLDAEGLARMEAAGYELRSNHERALPASCDEDVAAAAREAVRLLLEVYRCDPDADAELHLELEDVDHPTNESLVLALEATEEDASEAAGEELFHELLMSTLLIPVNENGTPTLAIDTDDRLAVLVFTDYPSLLASKLEYDGGYQQVDGPTLFEWALDQGASNLIVSSGNDSSLHLSREDLQSLVDAVEPA